MAHGPLTPSKLAEITGRSVQTISSHLAKLRTADIVRYETEGKQARYRIKYPGESKGVLEALEKAEGDLAQAIMDLQEQGSE